MSTISKKRKKNVYIIFGLIVIAVITLILILAQGKYKINNDSIHIQNSEMFYFESDLLELDEATQYTYSNWNVSDEYYSLKFNLKNYIDELRQNNLQTIYEIEIIPQTNVKEVHTYINYVESSNGVMNANENITDEVELRIEAFNESDIKLKVKVTSTSPYTKVLVADFEIKSVAVQENYEVNLIQNNRMDYCKLCMQINDFSGNLKIAYDESKTMPDMNCTLLKNVEKVQIENTNYYYIEITLEENKNYEIDFIKKGTNITLSKGDNIENYDIVVGYITQ